MAAANWKAANSLEPQGYSAIPASFIELLCCRRKLTYVETSFSGLRGMANSHSKNRTRKEVNWALGCGVTMTSLRSWPHVEDDPCASQMRPSSPWYTLDFQLISILARTMTPNKRPSSYEHSNLRGILLMRLVIWSGFDSQGSCCHPTCSVT